MARSSLQTVKPAQRGLQEHQAIEPEIIPPNLALSEENSDQHPLLKQYEKIARIALRNAEPGKKAA
jgi:hypothetical protein